MSSQTRPNLLVRLVAILCLALAYFGAAELGRYLTSNPQNVTPVWPAEGIALAAVLLLGYWICPGIFIGSCLFNLQVFLSSDRPIGTPLLLLETFSIGVGTTLGTLLGAYLLHKFVGRRNPFNRPRDTFKFLTFSGMLAPVVNATVGTTTLHLAGDISWARYDNVWLTWWISNVAGILIFTPLLLVWGDWVLARRQQPDAIVHSPNGWLRQIGRIGEALLLMGLVSGVSQVAFIIGYPVEYMLIPFVVWAAFRFGQRGATLMIAVISAIAVVGTVRGFGSFGSQATFTTALLLLQSFIGVVVFTTLILIAVITERQRALATLRLSEFRLREQTRQLERALDDLRHTQAQLVQTEKISSLGQLVAGVAHEVNNPLSFIASNLSHAKTYSQDLTEVLQLYQGYVCNPPMEIQKKIQDIDLTYVIEDLPKILNSMQVGTDRIREIMTSLCTFSRIDADQKQIADIHTGIDSTLLILKHRLKARPDRPEIHLIKKYGDLPLVECHPGQLNQVFMNLIANAIDALDEYSNQRSYTEIEKEPNVIEIRTEALEHDQVAIAVYNNGPGIPEEVKQRVFNAFYTTKPAGKGTGLGLSISYQIVVEKHDGSIKCISETGQGTEFVVKIPARHPKAVQVKNPWDDVQDVVRKRFDDIRWNRP